MYKIKMHKVLLFLGLLSLMGCTMAEVQDFRESNGQKRLKQCVTDFMDRDVSPELAVNVCKQIYKRWEKSE